MQRLIGFAKAPNRSRYDELHDRYDPILTTKQGTRYERLAAIVFKILEDNNVVIHDVQLRGASDVPHQIDVHIERDGRSRHVIIECSAKRIAELLVSGLGEADIVIFDDQLERHKIDAATGEVV